MNLTGNSYFGILFRFIFLVAFCINITGVGQNLVPNPSFENHTAVPCGFISVLPRNPADSNTIRRDNISNYVTDWYAPTSGTTDYWYFSDTVPRYRRGLDCANGASVQNQQPTKARTGDGYLGMYMTAHNPDVVNTQPDYREYAQVRLLQPLKAQRYYHVSLFVQINYESAYCTNQLGVLFSTDPITRPLTVDQAHLGPLLPYEPQILSSQYICQASQWVEVSRCFQAIGGEQYLTIGNFSDDAHINLQKTNIPYPGGYSVCYDLIDDVTVEEVGGPDYLPQANFLGADTTLCPGQQLLLTIPFKGGSVNWLGGDTTRMLVADQTGIYTATVRVGKCLVSDTVQVRIVSKLSPIPDTVLCRGDVYTITPTANIGQLQWDDGSTTAQRMISQDGIYRLQATDHQCYQADTIQVSFIDCPGEVPNVITPNGDGKNDRFTIEYITRTPWKLLIYNRWGALIYSADQYRNDWDASNVQGGIYYYLLQEGRSGKVIKGWVQVLR